MRRAGVHAGRVKTVEAAVGLMQRFGRREGRVDIGEVLLDLLYFERCAIWFGHQNSVDPSFVLTKNLPLKLYVIN